MLQKLGRSKVGKLDVICPGFVADCLETLEEIALEGKQTFLSSGGQEYRYIPSLNDRSDWIAALGARITRELEGWLTDGWSGDSEKVLADQSLEHAAMQGAKN